MADLALNLDDMSNVQQHSIAERFATLSFGTLAFIILAGTRPFESNLWSETGMSSGGSSIEALLYLVTSCICIASCLHQAPWNILNRWMVGLLVVLSYCAVSLTWSDTAFTGLVRLGQLTLVSVAIGAAVLTLGLQHVIACLYRVLIIILVLNIVSVAFIPGAIHQMGEPGTYPSHITSWKGVHIHKNYAGPVAAMTVMMAISRVVSGKVWHLSVAFAAFVVLWQTNSTASQLVLGLALATMLLSKTLCFALGKAVARFGLICLLAASLFAALFLTKSFAALLNDPYGLTGRVELWHALYSYIQAYPWTGSGFGSFWRVGDASPILHLSDGWPTQTGQGHNGYLDVAATIGIPGLGLTILFFCILPCLLLLQKVRASSPAYDVALGFFVFGLVHNSVETSLLSGNHPVYLALLVAIFGLCQLPSDAPQGNISDA